MTRKKVSVLFIFTLLFASSASFSKTQKSNSAFFYGSEPISLTGVIHSPVFPGPPNYSSIAKGDAVERPLILALEKPISVLPRKEKPLEYGDEPETNVRKLHLVLYSDRKINMIKDKRVIVTGTFIHAFTAHHRTEVLMEVEGIELLR